MSALRVVIAFASLTLAACATVSTAPRAVRPRANVVSNAAVIAQVHNGQSQEEVRGIMRHAPERREVGRFTESWGYTTSDADRMVTWITFTDRKVSSLSHEVVARD